MPSESHRSPTFSLRVRVRLHRRRLDRELADGLAPDRSDERALRAEQLNDPGARTRLARDLRRVVMEAEPTFEGILLPTMTVDRAAVRPAREALEGLAERLELPGPINTCGVARAALLLSDGAGPLYNPDAARPLDAALWWIADGFQACPPHAWGCPVIMKTDPDHVAWTCGRCGAIAVSDDPADKPA